MGKGKRNKKRKPMADGKMATTRSNKSNTIILIAIAVIASAAVIYFSN